MPRKRLTREESKARTRAELLRAASRLFLRKGFVDTSLADIAEEAALTKGAVYSNFESKEDLFLAVLQEWAENEEDDRIASWDRLVAGVKPSRRHLALFLEMNAVALRSEPVRAWVAQHNRTFFAQLGEELREVLDAPDADVDALGLAAQSLYVGLMMHAAFTDEPPGREVYAEAHRLLGELK